MKTVTNPSLMVLTPQAIKRLHETPSAEVPKKLDLIL